MSEPTISVLIPAHNAAAFIEQTLDSVVQQSLRPFEIVVVDDGSTDETARIVNRYVLSHGVRLVTQENSGQSAARNRALALASGEYIKFLDADDVLAPDALRLQVDRLRGRSNCIAASDWARFYDTVHSARFVPEPVWLDLDPVAWLVTSWDSGGGMSQCGMFLIPRRLLALAGGWNESLSFMEDFEFFTRVLLTCQEVLFTPGATLFYRSGLPNSVSGRRSREAAESALEAVTLSTQRLLREHDSSSTRHACATVLQAFVHNNFPDHPDLLARAKAEAVRLGGSSRAPDGSLGFHVLRRMIGWRAARRVELFAAKRGLTGNKLWRLCRPLFVSRQVGMFGQPTTEAVPTRHGPRASSELTYHYPSRREAISPRTRE